MKEYDINGDFLAYLRGFTKENINDDAFLRDCFFDSLIVVSDNEPAYFEILSDEWADKVMEEANVGIDGSYHLATKLGNTIDSELSINQLIVDTGSALKIQGDNAHHALKYAAAIKAFRNLIKDEPTLFDFFKQSLLQGLIKRNCRNHVDYRRLNELVCIYMEHVFKLELPEVLPELVDEEFLVKIPELRYADDDGYSYIKFLNSYLKNKVGISYLPR